MKKIDLTGKRYGHLTVLKENGKRGKNIFWLCRCDCGNEINANSYNLKNGHTQSCGCIRAFETPVRDRISNETILCACGCGTIIKRYSKCGRERKYVLGHNNRKRKWYMGFQPLRMGV